MLPYMTKSDVPSNTLKNQFFIDNSYLSSLICCYCNSIPRIPRVLNCCQKICCFMCLSNSENSLEPEKFSKCPGCQKSSKKLEPSKKIMKIFEKLNLKCKFSKCQSKIPFMQIEEHEKLCEFNLNGMKKCQVCKLEYNKVNGNHECIQDLLLACERTAKEINNIKVNCSDKNTELVYKIKHSTKIHIHPLTKTMRGYWICNTCNNNYRTTEAFYCFICDFDCCMKCFDYTYNKQDSNAGHSHPLTTSLNNNADFTCKICKADFSDTSVKYHCASSCNFNVCFKCRFK